MSAFSVTKVLYHFFFVQSVSARPYILEERQEGENNSGLQVKGEQKNCRKEVILHSDN